ncbi:MAG: hypothetical protein EXR69_12070 [Myxococcales bacterium]|nr:hypothetical protein [Myxococcales bacterium]
MPDAGEVRARLLQCSDELIADGEARIGDWMIENARARFGFRGSYSSLYALNQPGGTLLDAVLWNDDGSTSGDLLAELRVDGDRSDVTVENGNGEARIVLPGMTWTLRADDPVLRLSSFDDETAIATILAHVDAARTGTTWRSTWGGSGFLGTDGSAADGFVSPTVNLTFVTPANEAWVSGLYGGAHPISGEADADDIAVGIDGEALLRLPVVDGSYQGWAPVGAAVQGERSGCLYANTTTPDRHRIAPAACGAAVVRVRDQDGNDVSATFTDRDSGDAWTLPRGGGLLAAGVRRLNGVISAGPAYLSTNFEYAPGETRAVRMTREMNTENAVLADLGRPAWPDPDALWASEAAVHAATGEGYGYVVLVADDEIPPDDVAPIDAGVTDPVLAVGAVRSHCIGPTGGDGGSVTSWPWSPNSRRAAHGVPPSDLTALDLLAVAHDNSYNRRTVVDRAWVETALTEAPAWAWSDEPLGFHLDSLDDLVTFLDLLDAYVNLTPVGPLTWIELATADRNAVAVEAGMYAGGTTAGNGPRIEVFGGLSAGEHRVYEVQVDATRAMGVNSVTLWSPSDSTTYELTALGEPFGGGMVRVKVPEAAPWVVATVAGSDGSWAVRAILAGDGEASVGTMPRPDASADRRSTRAPARQPR